MFFILTMSLAGHSAQVTDRDRGRTPDMTSRGGWVKRLWQYYDRSGTHGWDATPLDLSKGERNGS
jgi:hypothetical protein